MAANNFFSIGDMAKLFHISSGTLRHYETIGLLTPEYIDPETGYRYYSDRQFEPLNTIRYLRMLNIPLPEIADFLQNKDIDLIEKKLCQQKEAIAKRQRELAMIERKIDHRLLQLRDARNSPLDQICVHQKEACRLAWIEGPISVKASIDLEEPLRKLCPDQAEPVTFLGKVGIGIRKEHLEHGDFREYDSVFLILDKEDRYNGEIEEVPASLCVSIHFCGSHGEAEAQYRKLMAYIRKNSLEVAGTSREVTLIDYGITNDINQFVTEISIPVKRV